MSLERREEMKLIANDLRVLHKAKGVIVIFMDADESPAGIAVERELEELLLAAAPRILRGVAAILEENPPERTVLKRQGVS